MISIIIPVYNCIDTISNCIASIQKQTEPDWELILVDDGAGDGSGSVCDQMTACDSRIRVFHKENGGVSSARNQGLEMARGEFVMFCDSDDYPEPDWCRELLKAAQAAPDRLPICNFYRKSPSWEHINREQDCGRLGGYLDTVDMYRLYQLELIGTPWNKIYRRDILECNQIRFRPDLSLGEDLIFNLAYIRHLCDGFTMINRPLYHYTVGGADSLSIKYYPDLNGIYRAIFSELKNAMCLIPGAFEKYRQDFYHSYFFAFDRVFRNTWSEKNPASPIEKWRYNAGIFSSDAFQTCRSTIGKHYINPLQYWGLRTNSFYIYWTMVVLSEAISRMIHKKGK